MKLNIDLEDVYGQDYESIAETINDAIRTELLAIAKKIAKEEMKKYETQIRKDIQAAMKTINIKDMIGK